MRILSVSLAAAAAMAASALPVAASAQSYGYAQNYGTGAYSPAYNYGPSRQAPDYCGRERQGRTGSGALIGSGAGAVIGSQLAARGRRTEGSILGGVVGALIGSQVGRASSENCEAYHGAPTAQSYGQPAYQEPIYDDRYADRGGYDYYRDYPDQNRTPVRAVDPYKSSDGCQLAESEVRLPDGRRDIRYVRTCPDASGRYRVVD